MKSPPSSGGPVLWPYLDAAGAHQRAVGHRALPAVVGSQAVDSWAAGTQVADTPAAETLVGDSRVVEGTGHLAAHTPNLRYFPEDHIRKPNRDYFVASVVGARRVHRR